MWKRETTTTTAYWRLQGASDSTDGGISEIPWRYTKINTAEDCVDTGRVAQKITIFLRTPAVSIVLLRKASVTFEPIDEEIRHHNATSQDE